jgi:predicted AlkP superfamily pyrophosphatase or phosphodiesterase
VVVVGVDGLSPLGIERTATPNIDALAARGAHTFHARAVIPTSSSPNWASMIMGAGPIQHGVTSNAWKINAYEIEPVARGPGGMFPTIFSVLRQQRPDSVIAVFHDWRGLARLLERDMCDTVQHFEGAPRSSEAAFKTARAAAEYFKAMRPTFMFVHLDNVDHAGHDNGWFSEPYEHEVRDADTLLGEIVAAIAEAGATDETIVLLTADHGGKKTRHGGNSMAELEIPWIIAGPGIKQGFAIKAPVATYDTAATLA